MLRLEYDKAQIEQVVDKIVKKTMNCKIAYIRKDALRFANNVLQHTVSAKNDFPEQAWADTADTIAKDGAL